MSQIRLVEEREINPGEGLVEVISISDVIVTDKNKFNKLKEELKNFRSYILKDDSINHASLQQMSDSELRANGYYVRYVHDFVEIYEYKSTYHGMEENTIAIFKNIRAKLLELMESIESDKNQILSLVGLHDSHPVVFLEMMFSVCRKANISKEELIYLFEEVAPQITTFATRLLDCIDFINVQNFDFMEMIKMRSEYFNKRENCELFSEKYFEYSSVINDINHKIIDATENSKVLGLARKINWYLE